MSTINLDDSATPTQLMKWGEWEENGYHDSYFYDAAWNVETGECVHIMTGATAFAGGGPQPVYVKWTDAELERARLWLASKITAVLIAAEHRDIFEPSKVSAMTEVRLLVEHKNAVKRDGERVKGEWRKFPAGTVAEVIRSDAFGTFYRNGYNKPDRSNTTVICRLIDGSTMKAPLAKLRLNREPATEAELATRADELSYGMQVKSFLTGHGGWWTHNTAASLMEAKVKALQIA